MNNDNINKIKININILNGINANENKSLKNNIHIKNVDDNSINNIVFNLLKGLHKVYKNVNAVKAVNTTQIVDINL